MAELRVLVCDDDHDMLELMLRRLDKMGFKPDRAGDGGAASALIKENLYDLIVTDIYMPEATGLELLEIAKQRDPQVQVVIVTASATLDNAIDALNHGAFGYLSKPFDHLSVFDSTISRALEFRQLIMANKRMAEAQKMRGDMLEDEVAKRVGQLREKQQGLLDLLNCLPDGIVVVEEGGKLMMTSPAAEQWLARERRAEQQPIAEFLGQVHSEWAEDSGYAQSGDEKLRLLAIDYPHPNGKRRKAVIIRRSEEAGAEPSGPGTLAVESIAAIKEGLAWLFRQKLSGPMQQRVKDLANHISMLEQLAGANGHADPGRPAPSLAPAVLPQYLRHEPALDSGAAWEEAEAASGRNGKSTSEAHPAEPDTRPAVKAAKPVEPPRPVQPAIPVDAPADEPAEELLAEQAAEAPLVEEPLAEEHLAEAPLAEEPLAEEPLVEELAEALPAEDELVAEDEFVAPEEEDLQAAALAEDLAAAAPAEQAEAVEDVPAVPPDLASAPTKVLHPEQAELLEGAQAEPEMGMVQAEEPAATSPTDTGRIPLWQRISQKRGATPPKGIGAKPQPAQEPAAEFEQEAELGVESDLEAKLFSEPAEDELADVAARLDALAGKQPAPEPGPKASKLEAKPRPPKAEASPKPRPQKAAAREPEMAVAGPSGGSSRGKKKIWPPQLPSQDPDFDPELDVTG